MDFDEEEKLCTVCKLILPREYFKNDEVTTCGTCETKRLKETILLESSEAIKKRKKEIEERKRKIENFITETLNKDDKLLKFEGIFLNYYLFTMIDISVHRKNIYRLISLLRVIFPFLIITIFCTLNNLFPIFI